MPEESRSSLMEHCALEVARCLLPTVNVKTVKTADTMLDTRVVSRAYAAALCEFRAGGLRSDAIDERIQDAVRNALASHLLNIPYKNLQTFAQISARHGDVWLQLAQYARFAEISDGLDIGRLGD